MRLTLLRAPGSPDPGADRGRHRFAYAIVPGAETGEALAQAHALNLPLRPAPGVGDLRPLVAVDNPDVVVESVKLADDRSGDVVARLYESRGGRAAVSVTAGFPLNHAVLADLRERPTGTGERSGDTVHLDLRPFQIVTLRLSPARLDG